MCITVPLEGVVEPHANTYTNQHFPFLIIKPVVNEKVDIQFVSSTYMSEENSVQVQ